MTPVSKPLLWSILGGAAVLVVVLLGVVMLQQQKQTSYLSNQAYTTDSPIVLSDDKALEMPTYSVRDGQQQVSTDDLTIVDDQDVNRKIQILKGVVYNEPIPNVAGTTRRIAVKVRLNGPAGDEIRDLNTLDVSGLRVRLPDGTERALLVSRPKKEGETLTLSNNYVFNLEFTGPWNQVRTIGNSGVYEAFAGAWVQRDAAPAPEDGIGFPASLFNVPDGQFRAANLSVSASIGGTPVSDEKTDVELAVRGSAQAAIAYLNDQK